ncbi:hypothetical protein M422DRAFT_262793 [Sphaerobolus stellatus SS14]|uniref:Uncharacterized protein n=1 Tax=Sphaerobolus stellatus (strain SS14) TaxID=990650 RepID=A0A0C9VC04_SPHS4|nr:hypothetical protein M422DRAFT_262793 [Sphaerobolus stellatus SS14]
MTPGTEELQSNAQVSAPPEQSRPKTRSNEYQPVSGRSSPTDILRGVAFIMHLIEEEDEIDPPQLPNMVIDEELVLSPQDLVDGEIVEPPHVQSTQFEDNGKRGGILSDEESPDHIQVELPKSSSMVIDVEPLQVQSMQFEDNGRDGDSPDHIHVELLKSSSMLIDVEPLQAQSTQFEDNGRDGGSPNHLHVELPKSSSMLIDEEPSHPHLEIRGLLLYDLPPKKPSVNT